VHFVDGMSKDDIVLVDVILCQSNNIIPSIASGAVVVEWLILITSMLLLSTVSKQRQRQR
jgi:hypothetical protein